VPGGGIDIRSEGEEPIPGDPCESDQRLVCLGVLYGLGDFADVGVKVIASLGQTGIAVLGLAALTLLLAIAGSSALAASSRRVASVARTD
jgi:4-alpha-glucanotransferase